MITDSQNTAKDLFIHLRVPEHKIRVVPLGVDIDRFRELPRDIIQQSCDKYGLMEPFLLFVGERRPHKNIPGLIKAFQLLCQMTSKHNRLVIAGRPYANYRIPEQMVEKSSLSDKVIFIDNLPDHDLPALYQAADAVVLLSSYEGFGLPVLEAMASGTPVIASNTTSLPEVVGDAGILVDPFDHNGVATAITQVITGGKQRETKIEAGLKRAKEFSWEKCAVKTLDVYKKAISF